jgi:phosphatidate cytidylyltransferase
MLKQRVITALIMATVFLLALFFLPAIYFSIFLSIFVLAAAWEWCGLSNITTIKLRIAYLVVVFLLLIAGFQINQERTIFIGVCSWWAIALLLVQGFPSSAILWGHKSVRLVMGLLVLAPTWMALVFLREQTNGAWLVLLLMLVVACADTGGYFAGRRFGKRKLAVAVSPGKTWEGFVGGLLTNIVLAVVISLTLHIHLFSLLSIIIPASLMSVLGDLFESMVKRHAGVKDSGHLLPGHGGVLDRVDGITAAAPAFALAILSNNYWSAGL